MFYAYMLECNDGTYYIGSTIDLKRRIHRHNNSKSGAHYTKIRRPVILRYFEFCESYSLARQREAELRKLTREQKKELISSTILQDLL